MKISLTKKEYANIYKFVASLKSNDANKIYNKIFGNTPHPGISIYNKEDNIEIVFDEKLSGQVLMVFLKYGFSIGSLMQCSGISLLTQAKALFKSAGPEFKKALDIK